MQYCWNDYRQDRPNIARKCFSENWLARLAVEESRLARNSCTVCCKSQPSVSPLVADSEPHVRRVTRSQSNANAGTFKAQWADALISQQVSNDVKIKSDSVLTLSLESLCKPP